MSKSCMPDNAAPISKKAVCLTIPLDSPVLIVYSVMYQDTQRGGDDCDLKIIIANNSTLPLYQQIKDQIKACILKEELKEGDPLPSIRAFANELQVSVLTVRRVYSELEEEGFAVSQAGLGTFVSTGNLELLQDARRRAVEEKLSDAIKTAKTLQISKDELQSMMNILYED